MNQATSGPKAQPRSKAKPRAKAPARERTKPKPAALIAAEAEIKNLKEELSDLQMLYDGTLEHAEAVEDQLAGTNHKLEGLSRKLARYLSPQIYNSIFTGQQTAEISAKRKKLTIFFSDIADFTQTTDSLESEELTGLLNHYLTEMAKIALDYGATIDKYIGDAILAFFGDPDSRGVREDALACVKMGIAMQRRMRELQGEWMNVGTEKPFQLRIGINTGFCTVGNFGSEDRMDYTIIGGEVNLAARLQSHAELGGILMAHETYSLVKDEIHAEALAPIMVKGVSQPVRTYRVLDILDVDVAETSVVRHHRPGARIDVDFRKISADDRRETLKLIEELCERLRSEGEIVPGGD